MTGAAGTKEFAVGPPRPEGGRPIEARPAPETATSEVAREPAVATIAVVGGVQPDASSAPPFASYATAQSAAAPDTTTTPEAQSVDPSTQGDPGSNAQQEPITKEIVEAAVPSPDPPSDAPQAVAVAQTIAVAAETEATPTEAAHADAHPEMPLTETHTDEATTT